jgi:hypothetical protein
LRQAIGKRGLRARFIISQLPIPESRGISHAKRINSPALCVKERAHVSARSLFGRVPLHAQKKKQKKVEQKSIVTDGMFLSIIKYTQRVPVSYFLTAKNRSQLIYIVCVCIGKNRNKIVAASFLQLSESLITTYQFRINSKYFYEEMSIT